MTDLSSLWGLLTVIGPLLLLVVLAWAVLHNRRSRSARDATERATARNYDEQDRIDRER